MKILYCRRCKTDMPMLDDDEWRIVETSLRASTLSIKTFRAEKGATLARASVEDVFQPALDAYERLTGFRETNPNALYHHRVVLYGPPCRKCGRPLRTPRARLCGSCMAPVE